MPTFSDGPPLNAAAEMPAPAPSAPASAGDIRRRLQQLLDAKETQLQQAGSLGQRVLAQRVELEERIRQLQGLDVDRADEEPVSAETRLCYHELAGMLSTWEDENALLSSVFGGKHAVNGFQHSPSMPDSELPNDDLFNPSAAPATTSTSSSRRAKNAAHRADDVEFAFEIGSSLLTEVRRLQSLLGERDKAIQDMKEEKDDLEKVVEGLRSTLRTQEQSADKFKEENWNLEVTLQELRTQHNESQAAVQRSDAEAKRLTKQLAGAREASDTHKTEAERLQGALADLRARHETDVAQARKHAAGLARDKADLQQSLDALKADAARAGRRGPRFGSPLTPGALSPAAPAHTPAPADEADGADGDADPFGASTNRRRMDNSALFPPDVFSSEYPDGESSPEPSPSRPRSLLVPNRPKTEVELLQEKLAYTQRQASTLKGTLQRERELRMEYRRKLVAAGLGGAALEDDEDAEQAEEEDEKTKTRRRATPGRGRGRGRGGALRNGGRLTLAQKLGMAVPSPSSEYLDDEHEHKVGDENEDEDDGFINVHAPEHDRSLEDDSPSNGTSMPADELDPAFANVLQRTPSATSLPHTASPLRQSVVAGQAAARGGATVGRRSRGGAAFQEARPSSLVGTPGALAAELGLSMEMDSVGEGDVTEVPKPETREFGCQAEFEAPVVLLTPPILITPDLVEAGVQAEPEPEPLPPAIERAEVSMQTDAVPRAEFGVLVNTLPPPPVLVDNATWTDTLLVPTTEVGSQTPRVATLDIDTQTPTPAVPVRPIMAEMEAQTSPTKEKVAVFPGGADASPRRGTLTQADYSRLRNLSTLSGDMTVRGVPRGMPVLEDDDDDDEGEMTETGPDTDTDMEDYQDAQSVVPTATPSDSVNDFHSMSTMTDNDFSGSSDDGESIKVSRLSSRQHLSTAPSVREGVAGPSKREVLYDSQAVSTDVIEELKREFKDMEMQTDEWVPPQPPAPPAAPIAISTSGQGVGLYRVGSNSLPFQFVSPPSSAPPTTTSTPITTQPPTSSILRDSTATIIAAPVRRSSPSITSHSDRRRSIESTLSNAEDAAHRPVAPLAPSLGPGLAPPVDKTRPPTMVLPPPPRMPPPPNTMLPPSFIPERRRPATSLPASTTLASRDRDIAPPRPSSPPPAELIQRATTPTFGSVLTVPGGRSVRPHGSSLPPNHSLRQPPSTNSFRSAANAAQLAPGSGFGTAVVFESPRERRLRSTASLLSEEDVASRRSSMSSEHFHAPRAASGAGAPGAHAPTTPGRANTSGGGSGLSGGATDPAIIHAITQTMIGEFLYKYTRKTIGKGHGERRHKRFFWVHPYTKTLYWSSADPGSSNVSESSAKSAYIDSVRSVLDPNPLPPGLYQYSVVISTPQREMKLTAPTKERHDIWLNALHYLLARPTPVVASPANVNGASESPARRPPNQVIASPQSQRSARSTQTAVSGDLPWNVTPRGQRSQSQLSFHGSVGKRSGTPAAEYLRWADWEGPTSPSIRGGLGQGFEHIPGAHADEDDEDLEFEIHDSNLRDDGFEGLENVRACCDGRHTVGRSGHEHHHHHHVNAQQQDRDAAQNHERAASDTLQPVARPVSPAWSFRSRASSTKSQEGGTGSLFSRFGSRRSAKTVPRANAPQE